MSRAGFVIKLGAKSVTQPKTGPIIKSRVRLATKLRADPITKPGVGPASKKKSLVPIVICHNH